MIDDDLCIRIADFGLSRISQATRTMTMTNGAGTTYWKAPEMIHDDEDDADESVDFEADTIISQKSKATDIWALGCTISEVSDSDLPWSIFRKSAKRISTSFWHC